MANTETDLGTHQRIEMAFSGLRGLSEGVSELRTLRNEHARKAQAELVKHTRALLESGAFPKRNTTVEREGQLAVEEIPLISLGRFFPQGFEVEDMGKYDRQIFVTGEGRIIDCEIDLSGTPNMTTQRQIDSNRAIENVNLAMQQIAYAYQDFLLQHGRQETTLSTS